MGKLFLNLGIDNNFLSMVSKYYIKTTKALNVNWEILFYTELIAFVHKVYLAKWNRIYNRQADHININSQKFMKRSKSNADLNGNKKLFSNNVLEKSLFTQYV